MQKIPMWRRYLRFFGPDVAADVGDELQFHIDAKTQELIAQGLPKEEARRQALAHFGDLSEFRAMCVEIGHQHQRRAEWKDHAESLWFDIRHALRALHHVPWFVFSSVVILAAGIGGATSLFTVLDAWIIRSVRFPDPQQIIFTKMRETKTGRETSTSFPDYLELAARSRQLQSLAAFTGDLFTLAHDNIPERVTGVQVSPNFFDTLSIQPVMGRTFLPQEGEFGNHRVVMVSHGFWKSRLRGETSAIGSNLELNGEQYVVIGVLPEAFHFTLTGRSNLWVPLAPKLEDRGKRQSRYMDLIGRLKPGVTVQQARQELESIAAQLAVAYPDTNHDVTVAAMLLSDEIDRHTGGQVLMVTFAVTVGLLLIACSNVASLFLVRALGRKRQAAIQLSLGANRGRLIRQGLLEAAVVFTLSGIAGSIGAVLFLRLITSQIPFHNRGYLPDYGEAPFRWTVLLFVLAVTLITSVFVGLVPALESSAANVLAVLKESGSSVSGTRKSKRLRWALVTGQIVLATVMLSATVLLVQGFRAQWSVPLGFDSNGVLTFRVSMENAKYPDAVRRNVLIDSITDALSTPDSRTAAASSAPFVDDIGSTTFQLPDAQPMEGSKKNRNLPRAGFNAVNPEFFAVLRTPVLSGRVFRASDTNTANPVAIVNKVFVSKYLNGVDPIGRSIILGRLKNRAATIVGVVPEIRDHDDSVKGFSQVFVPLAQSPPSDVYFIARAGSDPLQLLPEMRRKVAAIDPHLPIYDAKTVDERIDEAFAPYRILSGMLFWFGLLALILSAIGVYGVVAFSVSQRIKEIGIRAALGAGRSELLFLFFRQGLILLGTGLLPGLAAGYAAGTGLRSLFTDMLPASLTSTILFTAFIVAVSVVIATTLPARRASRIDPLTAIRYE